MCPFNIIIYVDNCTGPLYVVILILSVCEEVML